MKIIFDPNMLNKTDRKIYYSMTEAERKSYETTWCLLEEQKAKLKQKRNACKERAAREKKALADKERKARTHRLIERGAILESNINAPMELTNDDIKEIVERIFRTNNVKVFIEEVRARRKANG